MEAVFTPSSLPLLKKTTDPLEHSLELIGSITQIDFSFPSSTSHDVEKRVEIICEASHVKKRKVALKKNWWKEDHGPLLGFYGKEKKPVALIHSPFARYEIVEFDRKTKVVSSIALEISSIAYMFYPPLPPKIGFGKGIISFCLPYYFRLSFPRIFYALIGGVVALFPSIATKFLFQYAIPESNFSLILYLTTGLIFSAVGFVSFYFVRELFSLKFEGIVAHLVQSALWDRLLKLSPNFFRRFSTGNLFWRVSSVEEIRLLLSSHASKLLLSGIFSLFYLIIMTVYSTSLMMVAFGFMLIGMVTTFFCARYKIAILKKTIEVQGDVRGALIQMISGMSKLRTTAAEKSAFAYWASFVSKNKALQMKAQSIQDVVTTFSTFLPLLTVWGVYAFLMDGIGVRGLSLSDFLAFNIALGSFLLAIYPLNTTLMQLASLFPIWQRTYPLLEEPLEESVEKIAPGKLSGQICVDEVVFGYDPDRLPTLNDVTLNVEPHEFVGIVGPSGSGKSTLVRLLLGFEKPHSGAIYYDQKDLVNLDPRKVRRQIGTVFQGEGIMSGTLYDYLTCGVNYSKKEIEKTLLLSGFEEDLASLPLGLNTTIPMNGETLSGGQKQRLLLARALLGDPSILILDEATSALDSRSQNLISRNIETLKITRIVIAQRLSTIEHANRIYVLEGGSVVQMGTFDELAKRAGIFSEMLKRQKL